MVNVRHKEGWHHAKLFHQRQLVGAQHLGMNHHRANVRRIVELSCRTVKAIQILLRGGIAVAMGQKLAPFTQTLVDSFGELFIVG